MGPPRSQRADLLYRSESIYLGNPGPVSLLRKSGDAPLGLSQATVLRKYFGANGDLRNGEVVEPEDHGHVYRGGVSSTYRTRPEVKFAQFRELEQRRINASNMIWAMIVGSNMAASTLHATRESSQTLSELFPEIAHVKRFDMRSDSAKKLMGNAEIEMSTMGMTYAIALHEDFVKSCLAMLLPLGLISKGKLDDANTSNAHETMSNATGHTFDADALALFHVTRLIRNCHIHAGGKVSKQLVGAYAALDPSQITLWESLTGETLNAPVLGSAATVGVGGLIATLAVGKRLSYDVNLALQAVVPRSTWADMAANEYFELGSKKPQDSAALRSLRGYLRGGFGALNLTDGELQAAIARRK